MALADQVMSQGNEALLCLNVEGKVRYANNSACDNLGYPFEDMLSKTFADYTPDWSSESWGSHCKRTIENGTDSLYAYHTNCSGSRFPVELRSIPHLITETNEQLICTLVKKAEYSRRYIAMLEDAESSHRTGSFDYNTVDHTILASSNLMAMMGTEDPKDLRPEKMVGRLSKENASRWNTSLESLRTGFYRMDDNYRIQVAGDRTVLMHVVMWSRVQEGRVVGIKGHYELVDDTAKETMISLEENQRRHIISALRYTNGRVTGPNGAGKLLKINGKTLFARMKKLNINRDDYTQR